MYLSVTSPESVRFLALIRDGQNLKSSARIVGIGKETGYRFLRSRYLELRRSGMGSDAVVRALGFTSTRVLEWESAVEADARHHRQVAPGVEENFWHLYESGLDIQRAAEAAGVAPSSAYRWMRQRFDQLRADGMRERRCAQQLRLSDARARIFERQRLRQVQTQTNAERSAHRIALQTVALVADNTVACSEAQRRRRHREAKYWQLMREGVSNAEACRLLGMSRRTGTLIRTRADFRIPSRPSAPSTPHRYLDLRERVQIADLHRLGLSLRKIATHLGRHPSTVSRELRRHRTTEGLYLPRTADHDAQRQRSRPKQPRLATNPTLRRLVQRKLNRCWSPEEISGWLQQTYPGEPTMQLCHETIYRALLLREDAGLHKRYAVKLRTGRRIRKTRWRTRTGQGSRIRNMTMIDQRPADATDKQTAGHWEGDLIVGAGSVSAMVTLRERTTHYGLVVNLPDDHTATTVNKAITAAFAPLPRHLKRSLTWDQGVEMAAHEALTKATGVPVFFAERSSPWQRGANENFNGLLRQYFPKGTDLSQHSHQHVTQVVAELNNRPRKTLGYDTPAARFRAKKQAPRPVQIA